MHFFFQLEGGGQVMCSTFVSVYVCFAFARISSKNAMLEGGGYPDSFISSAIVFNSFSPLSSCLRPLAISGSV